MVLGLSLAAGGGAIVSVGPVAIFAVAAGTTRFVLLLIVGEVVGVSLLVLGVSIAEDGYRLGCLPTPPSRAPEVARRKRESWAVWFTGLAALIGAEAVSQVGGPVPALALVCGGIGLFLGSFILYEIALRAERESKLSSVPLP